MIKEKSSAAFVMNFGSMQNSNQIINEINLIKSRSVAEKVVDYLWKNEEKNDFHIFGSRVYKPRGQRIRNFFKEFFTLGFYDAEKNNSKSFSGMYTKEQLNIFSKRIQKSLKLQKKEMQTLLT